MRQSIEAQIVLRIGNKPWANFTVANATDIITSAAHGLQNGDAVYVSNSGGALPTGLSASTIYYVINATTNTFQLSTIPDGTSVDMSDDGSGTQTFKIYGKAVLCQDFQHATVSVDTKNSANLTLKFQGSTQQAAPTFIAAQSDTNQYDNIQTIDLQDGSSVAGDTGIAPAGTDDHRVLEFNINGLRWITANVTAFTAGNVQVKIALFSND